MWSKLKDTIMKPEEEQQVSENNSSNVFDDYAQLQAESSEYQLPEELNKRLLNKAEEMNLDSCDLLQLIIELALTSKTDIRVDFLESEKAKLEKYFSDKTEIDLDGTYIYYDKVNITLDVDVPNGKFDLVIMFIQEERNVAKKVIKPIENYLK